MLSSFIRIYVALFLMLAVSVPVTAMTVYDVIQLSKQDYSDEEIIDLVKVTDSAFELKADDIARLVELGVSEAVIQVMLKALPDELSVESTPDTPPGQHISHSADKSSGSEAAITHNIIKKLVPRADIDSMTLKEPGSGHHQHQVITLSGIQLFVLRDEGNYPSLVKRAKAVADGLSLASTMDGQFQPLHVAGSDAVMFAVTGTTQKVMIVTVSAQDASTYQRRSGRRVTADLLAAYWSDLLNDYWSLALDGMPPERLASLHEGEAMQALFDRLDKSVNSDTDRLAGAFQSLPKQERVHLLQLAVSVPRDFNATDVHTGETP